MRVRKTFEMTLQACLMVCDFAGIYFSYILAYFLYEKFFAPSPQPLGEVSQLALIPAGLGVASFFLTSVYRSDPGPLGLDQLKRVLSAYFWSGMMAFSLTFFTKSAGYSRLMVGFGFASGMFFVLVGRAIFFRVTSPIRKNHKFNRKILILGAGKVGKQLARNLIASAREGHQVLGFLDDQFGVVQETPIKVGEKTYLVQVLGTLADLEKICRTLGANEVIVAMTQAASAIHQDLFEKVKDLDIEFSIVPSALDLMLTGAQAYSIGRIPLFRIGEKPAFILTPYLKRLFDLLAALTIGFLSAPIWITAAIFIKLNSRGPVLFVHERVGKNGKKFNLYKFRSMKIEVDPYAVTPRNQFDPRITSVGKFIRRTSIDEIPQVLNIILGDMSMVGPRPEMPFIVDGYDELQKLRLSVKPGLTGVWQISADRANPIHENIDYDLYYLENQSLWLDMAILLKTLSSVVKGVGAY